MRKIRVMLVLGALLLFCFSMTVSAHEHEGHEYVINYRTYVNETFHKISYFCSTCNKDFTVLEEHPASSLRWIGSAKNYSGWEYRYSCCYGVIYNAKLTSIEAYKNSARLKVTLKGNICKGDLLEIKIGSKTYKKNISENKNDPVIKIKIKKPKKNSRIKVWITHAGKRLYLGSNYVRTSKHPKKGMTFEQVQKYTLWNAAEDDARIVYEDDGSEYWYFGNYDYIVFKNKKVVSWFYVKPFFKYYNTDE